MSAARLVPEERIKTRILLLRGQRVMLGQHLAELYGVPVRALVQAVRRNPDRFPDDFMFQLNRKEFENLKSQIVISSWGGLRRAVPYAFTEQGVAMLSSVLRSPRSVQVNVAIMRTFVRFREALVLNKVLAQGFAELERKIEGHDASIRTLFDAIRQLMAPPNPPRRRIGFSVREPSARYRVGRTSRNAGRRSSSIPIGQACPRAL